MGSVLVREALPAEFGFAVCSCLVYLHVSRCSASATYALDARFATGSLALFGQQQVQIKVVVETFGEAHREALHKELEAKVSDPFLDFCTCVLLSGDAGYMPGTPLHSTFKHGYLWDRHPRGEYGGSTRCVRRAHEMGHSDS